MPIGTFTIGTRAIGESTAEALVAVTGPMVGPVPGIAPGGVSPPNVVGPPQTVLVGAGSAPGGVGAPNVREPVHLTATATVTGSATGALGLLVPMDAAASFSVSITGVLFKPPLTTTLKTKVTLRGMLHVPALVIAPPDGVVVPSLKRISLIMPTPVLDASGLPT